MLKIFYYKKSIQKKFQAGFTLVETLVAIGVLSLSIAATFTVVQSSLQNSANAKDQIIAFYLAQEGMEFIKNIRDENALKSTNGQSNTWLTGFSENVTDPCYFGKTCTVDSSTKAITVCSGSFGTCPILRQDPNTGLIGYTGGWTATNFRRDIQFVQISAVEVKVDMFIYWTNRGSTKSMEVTENLFNRQ